MGRKPYDQRRIPHAVPLTCKPHRRWSSRLPRRTHMGSRTPGQDYDYPRASWAAWDNNYASSTLYEKDSKYLRLKTIQLAYNLRTPWLKKAGMNTVQIAASAYNLLTFTPYLFGDPETRASDSPSYPLQRTYTVSLKINF